MDDVVGTGLHRFRAKADAENHLHEDGVSGAQGLAIVVVCDTTLHAPDALAVRFRLALETDERIAHRAGATRDAAKVRRVLLRDGLTALCDQGCSLVSENARARRATSWGMMTCFCIVVHIRKEPLAAAYAARGAPFVGTVTGTVPS